MAARQASGVSHQLPENGCSRMAFRPDRAFKDMPALSPAQDIETKAVLKAWI